MPLISTSFRINSTTAESQTAPSVSVLRDGRLVVAWTDDSNINVVDVGRDIRAQILNADGSTDALDFKVNTETAVATNFENNYQFNPDVTALANGGFAIAFTDTISSSDTSFRSTTALQRFDSAGAALGGNQLVFPSVAPNGNSVFPGAVSIAGLNNGGVAFVGQTTDISLLPLDPNGKILLNTVNASGVLGTLIPGSGLGTGNEIKPQIITLSTGNTAVAYLSDEGHRDQYDLRVQIRTPAGSTVGSEISVPNLNLFSNSNTAFSIAALDAGRFVVTWHQPVTFEQSQAGQTVNILAQVYEADGTQVGGMINVHAADDLSQSNPVVAGQPDGSFLVVWEEYAGSSGGNYLRGQLFNADGTANGEMFSLGVEQGGHSEVDISLTNDGRYLVVWADRTIQEGEPDAASIRGQYIDPRSSAVDWKGVALGEQYVGTDFADTLNGGNGSDTLWGGGGNDVFKGSAGRDVFHGDAGNDTFYVSASAQVFESAGEGTADRVIARTSFTLAAGQDIEILQADDVALASPMQLRGNELANTVIGNTQANALYGLSGQDTLNGRGGNDTLVGGSGLDRITGGANSDTFVLIKGSPNADTITDFTHDLDVLQLDAASLAAGLVAGALDPSRFVANSSGLAESSDHRFIYETDTGKLFFDSNGTGTGGRSLIATLLGTPTLDAGDFSLV